MDSDSVARRYAKALFALAQEGGRVEAWADALAQLASVLQGEPELSETIGNPVHTREERHAMAARLGEAFQLEPDPRNLLLLLADRNRLDRLADVLRAYAELADAHLGRVRARVTSAVPLAPESVEALARLLSQATRKTVLVDRAVEPALLGGVVAQVGSMVYDGSVRTQLEDLKASLKR